MKKYQFIISTSIIILGLAISTNIVAYKADAQTTGVTLFGGTIGSEVNVCCNGFTVDVDATITNSGSGTYIIDWYAIGLSYLESYAPLQNNNTLGQAMSGGVCITISSECESEDSVDYEISYPPTYMGTSLSPSSGQ